MLKNLRCEQDVQKTAADTQKKLCPKKMTQGTAEDWDKENKGHGQLKISELAQRRKVQNRLVSLRETFALFSRIHESCLSKIHTLFMAFQLYEMATSNPALTHISQTYKQLCCMYMSMKYEEIYHVDLMELASYLRVNYNLADYRRHEKAIILAFGGNLHVETADRILEGQFQEGKYTKKEEMRSFYLLELCYTSAKIYRAFKDQEICKAIGKIVKYSQSKDTKEAEKLKDPSIDKIARLILSSRNNMKRLQHIIFQKYQSDKYEQVSSLPI